MELLWIHFSYLSEFGSEPDLGIASLLGAELSILLAGFIFLIISKAGSAGRIPRQRPSKLKDYLLAYFDQDEVEHAFRFYIPINFDQVIPGNKKAEEANKAIKSSHRSLISYLTDNGLRDSNSYRYFLILANAGIGKTTFILNLYHACINDKLYVDKVVVLPLRDPNTLETLQELPNKSEITLLLDGFNEDSKAVLNYQRRLEEVLAATQEFRKVVITCRGYFFSTELKLPFKEYLIEQNGKWEGQRLTCFSLDFFNNDQVSNYIKKKYSFWHMKKRKRAMKMVEQTPHLMRQPLLLSYAETLIEANKRDYNYSYEIYEDLVLTWINRASLAHPEDTRELFAQRLFQLMKEIALSIYQKHIKGIMPFLGEEEVMALVKKYDLNPNEIRADSRSIISHHVDQGYRFSHSSIMEYFVAKEAYENFEFFKKLSFAGMDQAQKFLQELIIHNNMVKVKGASMKLSKAHGKYSDEKVHINTFYISKYPVVVNQYRIYCEANELPMPSEPEWGWEETAPVVFVNWEDVQNYCKWLGQLTGLKFRLPHELEWEFAAKGGRKNRKFSFSGGRQVEKFAWYSKNALRRTHPVGELDANQLGLHDMSGNVWEWCENWYEEHKDSYEGQEIEPLDPRGRAIRGGSWLNHAASCATDTRGFSQPQAKSYIIGFRLAVEIDDETP